MLRYTTYDPLETGNGGILISGDPPVGTVLDQLRDFFLSKEGVSRWKEVTDDDPTPEYLRQYASDYTLGSSSGSWEQNQITFYLVDDVGLQLDPVRYRLMRISKFRSTSTSSRIIVNVFESSWLGFISSYSSTSTAVGYYLISSGNSRIQIFEADNWIGFVTYNFGGGSHLSYNLITYLDPPEGSNVDRASLYAPHITVTNYTDQNSTNSVLPSNSYILARQYYNDGYITPVLPIFPNFGPDDNVLVGRAQIVRSGSQGFYMGELDDVLCCARTIGNELDPITINGRRYIRGAHYYTDSSSSSDHTLVILYPIE